jgi:hypothetical protein
MQLVLASQRLNDPMMKYWAKKYPQVLASEAATVFAIHGSFSWSGEPSRRNMKLCSTSIAETRE